MTDAWTIGVIAVMALVTVLTRGFFLISSRPWKLPSWAQRALQHAPIAAVAAVVIPEILMSQGQLAGLQDARIFGALAGVAAFTWRRSVLHTMLAGMAVYLPLHVGLGW